MEYNYKVKVERVNNKYKNKIKEDDLLFISNNKKFKNKGIIISGASKSNMETIKSTLNESIYKKMEELYRKAPFLFGNSTYKTNINYGNYKNIFIHITNCFFLRFNETYKKLENNKSNFYKITPYLKISITKKEDTLQKSNDLYIEDNIEYKRGNMLGADFFTFENESVDIGLKFDTWNFKELK